MPPRTCTLASANDVRREKWQTRPFTDLSPDSSVGSLAFSHPTVNNIRRRQVIRSAPFDTGGSRGPKIPGSSTPQAKYEMNRCGSGLGHSLRPDSLGCVWGTSLQPLGQPPSCWDGRAPVFFTSRSHSCPHEGAPNATTAWLRLSI